MLRAHGSGEPDFAGRATSMQPIREEGEDAIMQRWILPWPSLPSVLLACMTDSGALLQEAGSFVPQHPGQALICSGRVLAQRIRTLYQTLAS